MVGWLMVVDQKMKQLYLFFLLFFIIKIVKSKNVVTTKKTPTATSADNHIETYLIVVLCFVAAFVFFALFGAGVMYYFCIYLPKEDKKEAAAAAAAKKKKDQKRTKKKAAKDDEEEEPKPKNKKKTSTTKTGKLSDSVNQNLPSKKEDDEKQMPSSQAKVDKPEESTQEQQQQNQLPPARQKQKVKYIYTKPKIVQEAAADPFAEDIGGGGSAIQRTQLDPTLGTFSTQTDPTVGTFTTQTDPTVGTFTTQTDPTLRSTLDSQKSLQSITGSNKVVRQTPQPHERPRKNVIVNGRFDYHYDEPKKFETTIDMTGYMPSFCFPPIKQFQNFWSCLETLSVTDRFAPVFVNPKVGGANIYFMVRDLIAHPVVFNQYAILANRILEPINSDGPKGANVDEKKKVYMIRVFIISYEPLTLEIHCRGKCPLFLFSIFRCKTCSNHLKRYQENQWLIPAEEGNDDWEKFVCRVKRIPVNSHQVLCYNGPKPKPKSFEDVNHIFVIRGDFKSKNVCPCSRKCTFTDRSHPNSYKLAPARKGSSTASTQAATND